MARLLRQLRFQWADFALAPQIGSAIAFPGVELKFGNDIELFEAEIARAFPREKDNFRRLLQRLVDYDDLNPAHFEMSARQVLDETIGDPLLREMILCPLMWYGNAPSTTCRSASSASCSAAFSWKASRGRWRESA